jgi:glutathione S-transferase
VYVARKYGGEKWLPTDPLGMAEVMQWLALANNEIHYGLQWARGVKRGIKQGNLEEYQGYGKQGLAVMEGRLKDHEWLALDRPTIADVACFPYVQVAPEGGFDLNAYPGVSRWLKRCEALPGWPKRG